MQVAVIRCLSYLFIDWAVSIVTHCSGPVLSYLLVQGLESEKVLLMCMCQDTQIEDRTGQSALAGSSLTLLP